VLSALPQLDERLLGDVRRAVCVVEDARHAVDDRPPVAAHQLMQCQSVVLGEKPHQLLVSRRFRRRRES
jgi:hypothetical protein